jgi:hypothetical protein
MKNNAHIEIAQMHLQAAAEQTQNLEFFILGHISAYDPATSRCKVIYPYYTDNINSQYTESGWTQLATCWSGNGFGDQIAPFGGATITDLTGKTNNDNDNPEQCLVFLVQREGAFHVMGAFLFNQQDIPPGSNQTFYAPDGSNQMLTISGGERVIKHSSGTYVYFKNDGSINIIANTNPHDPYKEMDPDNLVRQVNVQAIAAKEQSNNNSDPTSITTSVLNAARSTGTNHVETVTAVANTSASATTGKNVNATITAISGSTGTVTSDATAIYGAQATGQAATTAVGQMLIEAPSGLDATAAMTQAASATGTASSTATNTVSTLASGAGTNAANTNITAKAITGTSPTADLELTATSSTAGQALVNMAALGGPTALVSISSTGNITIQSALNVTITGGTTIDITAPIINAQGATVNVTAATLANVTAPQVNLISAAVILGIGTARRLLNDLAAQIFNIHTHQGAGTGPPYQQITPFEECQNVFGS